ncbi:MAG TPA: hypothetical protein VE344_11765 [Methylomirabilota bacterium]|nr:hypothetical protein [Methylomirabilota bacterium]
MSQHKEYIFSVTIQSDDLGLICAMRGLAWHCQIDGNKQISWGNIKEKDWAAAGRKATFHFSRQNYRDNFVREAQILFRDGLWSVANQSNNDPARRAD